MTRQNCKNCGEPYSFDPIVTPGREVRACGACQKVIYTHTGQIVLESKKSVIAEPTPVRLAPGVALVQYSAVAVSQKTRAYPAPAHKAESHGKHDHAAYSAHHPHPEWKKAEGHGHEEVASEAGFSESMRPGDGHPNSSFDRTLIEDAGESRGRAAYEPLKKEGKAVLHFRGTWRVLYAFSILHLAICAWLGVMIYKMEFIFSDSFRDKMINPEHPLEAIAPLIISTEIVLWFFCFMFLSISVICFMIARFLRKLSKRRFVLDLRV